MSDDGKDHSRKSAFSSADPPRNFTLRVDERVRALTIGVPAYAARKKQLEDLEERFVHMLVALHDTMVARQRKQGSRDEQAIALALVAKASSLDLKKMNALVEAHNRYYPMEANLPMDLRTGEYLVYGRRWLPESAWTAERLLARARSILDERAARDSR